MKNLKKTLSFILALVMCMSLCVPAFADGKMSFTAEELQEIVATNKKIDNFMHSQGITRAGDFCMLNMTVIRQENERYCGPAACCMVANTLNLENLTQEAMAGRLGTQNGGTSSDQIADTLNDLLKEKGRSDRYQLTKISESSLIDSALYSLANGYPVVVNVKEMPRYTVNVGHFIVIRGYYAAAHGDSGVSNFHICDPHYKYYGPYEYPMETIVNASKSSMYGKFVRLE